MPLFDLESGPSYLLLLAITSAAYILMVFAMRLFLRLKVNGPFGKDDWSCAISTFFGLVYSIIVISQLFLGFGSALRYIPPSTERTLAIMGWTNTFCLTFAGYFSKMSACFLLTRITKTKQHLAVAYGLMVLMTLWMLQGQIYTVFQCKYPHPWDTSPRNVCYNQWGHRLATAIMSWIAELALLAGAAHLVWSTNMHRKTKAKVIIAFALRLLIIPPSAVRLSSMHSSITNASSASSAVRYQVMSMFGCQVSVISATIPCAKPFFSVFSRGIMGRPPDSILPITRPATCRETSDHTRRLPVRDREQSIGRLALQPNRGVTYANAEHLPSHPCESQQLSPNSKRSDNSIAYTRQFEVNFQDVGGVLSAANNDGVAPGAMTSGTSGSECPWKRTSRTEPVQKKDTDSVQ